MFRRPATRTRTHAPATRHRAVRAGVLASLCAALVLGGCQLPVAFGGFGVFTSGGEDGTPDGTTNPDQPGPGDGGNPQNNAPVSTTGGGVPQGNISVAGTAKVDDRTSHTGIDVTLRRGERSTTKRTDAQGAYRFDKVETGQYTLTVVKTGYASQQLDVFIERDNQQLPAVSLTSPIVAIEVSAATDTVYVAPADPRDFAILPTTVQLKAKLAKENGDRLDGNTATIRWGSADAAQATVTADGLVTAATTALAGSVAITATSKLNEAIAGSILLTVSDPGSIADVRILSLGERRGRDGER